MSRLMHMLGSVSESLLTAALFAGVGVAIGIGELMASSATLTPRLVIGRALSTGGIAMAAGMVLVWVPDLPFSGQIGVAAALASLGTSGLERVFSRLIGSREPPHEQHD